MLRKITFLLILTFLVTGLNYTLSAQKITLEPGMGLGFGILTLTTPVATPSFDQVGNDDGIRYVMEKGNVATLQYSLRYKFNLFSKK